MAVTSKGSAPKFWFLRMVYEGKAFRLRAFPNQVIEIPGRGMHEVEEVKNVLASKLFKGAAKNLQVFATDGLRWNDVNYQITGKVYVIHDTDIEGADTVDWASLGVLEATSEVIAEWAKFSDKRVSSFSVAAKESISKGKPVTQLEKLIANPKYAKPTIEESGFYVDEDVWWYALRNALNSENTLIVGPSGSGKSELTALLAKAVGKELFQKDMSAAQDPCAYFLGTHRIKGKESVFDYAPFTYQIQQPSFITLDEINRAPGTSNNILFPVLDGRRTLEIDMADEDGERKIKVHDDCVFFATANIGAEYSGTQQLDRALLDRFVMIELSYMPSENEVDVLTKRTTIDKPRAEIIVSVANSIRNIYAKGDLAADVSHRHTLKVAQLTADGFEPLKAMELVFCPMFEGNRIEGERSVIYSLFMSK